ncbi:hypothetical protein PT974_11529 [Cladobotryum mycophilum]|uniref:alpha-galactosidase n=1 Tax=Cladobotryum mycophilum TaxID=491253 RepID=A0ABR0S5H4_9HYPO
MSSTIKLREAAAERQDDKHKQSWPLWKKLVLVVGAILVVIVIALSVGLAVGLKKAKGGDGHSNSGSDGSNDPGHPRIGPNRTTTWQPKVNATWQIVLKGAIKIDNTASPDVDVWDLDVFDNDVQTFKALQDAGKKVICYFSAGSWEDFRPDKDKFDESDLGKPLDGWPHERWLNLSSASVRNVMKERIRLAWSKGCDAIDPDNVDGYQNNNGLGLTKQDSIDYMKFLHKEASSFHMAVGLKNAGDIIPDLLDVIDFSVNEQCAQYTECETFSAFIKAGKPVFHIEYPSGAPKIDPKKAGELCSNAGIGTGSANFSTVLKKMELDGFVQYCDGKRYDTPLNG